MISSEELVERLQDILRISSASSFDLSQHVGNRKVAEYLADWAKDFLQVRIVESGHFKDDVTFICWPKTSDFPAKGGLALNTHLDTVQAGSDKLWTEGGAFEARRVGSKIVGLGASDVKSDAICKIAALLRFSPEQTFKRTPFFVGSFAEEIGMQGARWIQKHQLIEPQYALVGEPSEGHISYANKGLFLIVGEIPFEPEPYQGQTFEIHYDGSGGHSSAPHKAINALELALDDLPYQLEKSTPISRLDGSVAANVIPGNYSYHSGVDKIPRKVLSRLASIRERHREFQSQLSSLEKNNIFQPSTATSSWTVLRRDENKLSFQIEGRYLPGQNVDSLIGDFLNQNSELRLDRVSPACFQDPKSEFGEILDQIKKADKKWITKSGSNEANFFREMGAEVFVHGPGISYGNIHRPNERVEIASLSEAYDFYQKVIRAVCLS